MKSLALHLLAILLLGSLQTTANKYFLTTAAASISASTLPTTTTTQQLPTLHAPHRSSQPPTTLMTTPNTEVTTTAAIPTANRRQNQQASVARRIPAQANSMTSTNADATSVMFSSARLVRNANIANTTNSNGVRPNRSLQNTATAEQRNSNANNSEAKTKNQQPESRRQRFRPNKDNTNSGSTAQVSSTVVTPRTSQSTAERSSSEEHDQKAFALKTSGRQPRKLILAADSSDVSATVSEKHAAHSINSTNSQQTLKTPRMIQRLVAGHIQNAEGRSTFEVSTVSTNSSVSASSSSNSKNIIPLYRRKEMVLSSTFRKSKISTTTAPTLVITTTANNPIHNLSTTVQNNDDYGDDNDDEALLDDAGDFDNWDNGILRLSAGSGKESSPKSKKNKEDSKKTLSDQVRDGKYGLIEKEIFRREPKRPGVLSYLPNKEVPFDNERNYGGLNEEDIWLAEDHLLVIKGGSLNEDKLDEPWPPIDDYDAPGRQIKIPKHPKVPPPFPVQLEENGPIQFIGNNKFTVVYPVTNESLPIYPVGPETNYASPENDSDDEKNLITGTRSPQDTTKVEPGYLYPAPYPPWLYHNQTFVNPILSNTRPINFPSLGPFPFGRNGSLENSNGTDYFDEDDPSLYYPPAYSFVYKNNYSNPVPPGPIVPGIVLPPPPDQFSRLEKEERISTTSNPPSTTYLPTRHRVYSTTSVPTTITTTTEMPHRQVITKISEYTPKTITITPIPPTVSTPIQTKTVVRFPPSPPPTPITPVLTRVEPVPVPVAVPVPIYPSNHYQTERPGIVSFVPTTPSPTIETLSKSNPIYYDYVEAKRKPTTSNVIDDFLSTTNKPPVSERPVKLYPANKRPPKGQSHRHYLPANRPFIQENVVYITPKPEVRYKPPTHVTLYKPRPLENFENEVNAIRETLRYYQNQQLRDNNIPRTPKAKTVYEYSFDATKNLQPVQPIASANFKPPTEFDEEPFQPMVTYSPPVDDENSFRAIAFDKVDSETQEQPQPQPKYQTSTTLIPVEPEAQYQRTSQGRSKKLRLSAKYIEQPLVASYQRQQQQQEPRISQEYQSTPRTILTTQAPWVSIDESRISDYRQSQQQHEQYERVQIPYKNRFPGYYYGSPQPPIRQNNRFYDEPFQGGPVRKIINYRPPLPPAQQQQQQQAPIWSLENDTYVNYAPNRPPLNPDAEFIDPYQTIPINPYRNQGSRLPLPPLSHQSQYYAPPQRLLPSLRQQQQQHPLHRDILVNYRQPLPPLNPESEYISHPQVVRNQPQQVYRENDYRQLPNVGEQGNVYYITPKYRRAYTSNNNNNNNNNNNGNTGSENNGK